MRTLLLVLVSALGLSPLPGLRADGGTLRIANAPVGAYRVSVFTEPTPIPPDTIDVSVLATIGRGGEPAEGLQIEVEARRLDGDGTVLRRPATRGQATDPRYYAANFALGSAGEWEIRIHLKGPDGEGDVSFQVKVGEGGPLKNPFVILGLALLPLILVGGWLRLSSPSNRPGG